MASRHRRSTKSAERTLPSSGPPLNTEIPTSTGTVRIVDEGDGSLTVEVNGVPSSHIHPDPTHLVFEYMRWMMLAVEEWTESLSPLDGADGLQIAHLGGGACALPRALHARFPASRHIVVELDQVLVDSVRTWFDLPRSPALRIRHGDAAEVLREWREARFDVIIRDVFAGDTTPENLCDHDAASHAARVLRPGGLYLVNSAGQQGSSQLADEVATLSEVFAHVGVVAEPAVVRGKRRGNSVLMASSAPLPESLERRLRSDPVSVRLLPPDDVSRLARSGSVIRTAHCQDRVTTA